jgi:predicted nucleotidyltransferase
MINSAQKPNKQNIKMTVKTAADLKTVELEAYRPFPLSENRESSPAAVEDGYAVAKEIAAALVRRYKAKKAVLFGSLARGELHARSDIDLAVWGIPDSVFYRAVAFATGFSKKWKIDIVDGDDCSETLSQVIQKEGVEL